MNKEKIEDANMGILNDLDGHKKLLVSFGGIRQGLGVPVFEFFNSISDIPCDKIFLRDFNQAWYQKGVDPRLNNVDKLSCHINHIIRENKYDKICFLGNSMGAYAAILFGCKINVDVVISFAPQTFINRFHRIIYCDNRWQKQINNMYTLENKNKKYYDIKSYIKNIKKYKKRIKIYYSPLNKLDKIHAVRLKGMHNITLNPIKEGGHAVVKILRDSGELKSIIKENILY